MKKGNIFIRNPYLAIVIACVVTLCGVLSITDMPLSEYPDVTPPQVSVGVTYPGADSETLLESVIIPLEKQINSAPGLIYLESTASNSGVGTITATFATGTNHEINAQNVQDRVNWATPQLPEAVRAEGVIVREQSSNILLGISVSSPGGTYDTLFMSNYAAINIQEKLERIPGVGRVMIFGGSDYAMRVWLDTGKCASLGLSTEEVLQALKTQNAQVSAGSVGAAPAEKDQRFVYNVSVKGRLADRDEFSKIIVRSENGANVYLGDVAEIELASENYTTECSLNGRQAVMMIIFQSGGANAIAISKACRAETAILAKDFPPDLECGFQFDTTNSVRTGIRSVAATLLLAVGLVILVTFLFLQDWRMALIPALAIPVSIVGTFAVLRLLGYSINMITLFALTLAIGIVVDDAIIVIENVSRLMDDEHLSPAEAAEKSMRQITGAIAATTAVLLAMFVPLCFFSGITGELYRQFGVTISAAVTLSAFNALTLSPALSAVLLKTHETQSRFFLFRWFNSAFMRVSAAGGATLRIMMKLSVIVMICVVLGGAYLMHVYSQRPAGFIPQEDQGYFFTEIMAPPGTSLNRTADSTFEAAGTQKRLPGVADVIAVPGYNLLTGIPDSASGFVIAILEPWDKRTSKKLSAERIMETAQFMMYENLTSAFALAFQPPPIPGIGTAGGFDFVLEERSSDDPARLGAELYRIINKASADKRLKNVFSSFGDSTPGLYLNIDREKLIRMGVNLESVNTLLENTLGYSFINEFNRFGQVYKLEIQAGVKDRSSAQNIMNLHVQNNSGGSVPLASIAAIKEKTVPAFLTRHNLKLAASIQGSPADGHSSGDAMTAMRELAAELPDGMTYEWSGMSYQEAAAGDKTPWILALAVTFIFLFLSALYSSFMLPFAVLPAILPALGGALAFLAAGGIDNNIYTQIGVVLLFGMACKTAILVVDFAENTHRQGGKSPLESALEGARLRFRAVMMTSLAFIFGAMPLMYAAGPSAGSQHSIGYPVVGGMIGTILAGLLVSPVFFSVIRRLKDRRKKSKSVLLFMAPAFLAIIIIMSSGGCYTPPEKGALIESRSFTVSVMPRGDEKLLENIKELTCADAVVIALKNNPTYLSAFSGVTAAKMRYYQALGAYSPQLSTVMTFGEQKFANGGGDAADVSSFYTYSTVQANWMIFNGLAREFEVLAALRNRKMNDFLCENAKRVLIQAVYLAYDEILSSEAHMRIARSNMAFQQEQLRRAVREHETGENSESALLNFKTRYNQAEMDLLKAGNRGETARFSLALVMGYPESRFPENIAFSPACEDALINAGMMNVDFYLNEAIANRSDLNAIREGLCLLKYRYYQTWSAFSPSLSAFIGYSYSTNNYQNGGSGGSGGNFGNLFQSGGYFSYGALATLDIFDGFIRYNRLREARATLDQAYFRASDEWIKTVNEVRSAYSDAQYAEKLLALSGATLEITLRRRNIAKREYEVGEIPLIELDQAQDALVKSECELADAKTALHKALVRLYSAAAMKIPDGTGLKIQ